MKFNNIVLIALVCFLALALAKNTLRRKGVNSRFHNSKIRMRHHKKQDAGAATPATPATTAPAQTIAPVTEAPVTSAPAEKQAEPEPKSDEQKPKQDADKNAPVDAEQKAHEEPAPSNEDPDFCHYHCYSNQVGVHCLEDRDHGMCGVGIYFKKENCDAKGFRCRWDGEREKCVSRCDCCGKKFCDRSDWNPDQKPYCGVKTEFNENELSPYFCERNCFYEDAFGQQCKEKTDGEENPIKFDLRCSSQKDVGSCDNHHPKCRWDAAHEKCISRCDCCGQWCKQDAWRSELPHCANEESTQMDKKAEENPEVDITEVENKEDMISQADGTTDDENQAEKANEAKKHHKKRKVSKRH